MKNEYDRFVCGADCCCCGYSAGGYRYGRRADSDACSATLLSCSAGISHCGLCLPFSHSSDGFPVPQKGQRQNGDRTGFAVYGSFRAGHSLFGRMESGDHQKTAWRISCSPCPVFSRDSAESKAEAGPGAEHCVFPGSRNLRRPFQCRQPVDGTVFPQQNGG